MTLGSLFARSFEKGGRRVKKTGGGLTGIVSTYMTFETKEDLGRAREQGGGPFERGKEGGEV